MLSSLSFLYHLAWLTVSSFLTSLFSGFSRLLYRRAAHLDCESLVEGGGHADTADSEENVREVWSYREIQLTVLVLGHLRRRCP